MPPGRAVEELLQVFQPDSGCFFSFSPSRRKMLVFCLSMLMKCRIMYSGSIFSCPPWRSRGVKTQVAVSWQQAVKT
ncbi:hypothetical protein AMEX_G4799 [Astyanax mexicanus]|uniref:Uncharacterized protein n=1 Tax=Astyanax mexicanus TaxID=7994 RepID=A0A8T2M7Y1_ASTMX|nr:hypothetical protein AMEX_G4799 [Astyanax mexicanus]